MWNSIFANIEFYSISDKPKEKFNDLKVLKVIRVL